MRLIAALTLVFLMTCATPGREFANPALLRPVVPAEVQVHRRVAVIDLVGGINAETAETFSDIFSRLQFGPEPPDEIVVRIHSPGGEVDSAYSMAKDILAAPAPVTCVVEDYAASAAYFLLQACQTRVVTPKSVLMIHEATLHIEGPVTPEQAAFFELLTKSTNDAMAGPQCFRLNISREECRERYRGKEWWIGPLEALEVGAADAWAPSTIYVIQKLMVTPKD
jgi:ATP-dependent protease ClpP protease subunit